MEKRSKLMKDFEEIRNRQLEVWNSQKPRRLELRSSKYIFETCLTETKIVYTVTYLNWPTIF